MVNSKLKDLHHPKIIISSDHQVMIATLFKLSKWPRYCTLIEMIFIVTPYFSSCSFELVSQSSNSITRDIAKSVTHDGRYQSYLAMGGPSWLHDRLMAEVRIYV